MDQDSFYKIPLAKVVLGSFETVGVEELEICQKSMQFMLKCNKIESIHLKRSDVTKIEPCFGPDEYYLQIGIRPGVGKTIAQMVPKEFKFVFYSQDKKDSAFRLYFIELTDTDKKKIEEFINFIPCVSESNAIEIDDEPEPTEVVRPIKTKSKSPDDFDAPPKKKTKKGEDDYVPTRNLRSKTQPKLAKQMDPMDYIVDDDDDIPPEVRKFVETPRPPSPSPFDRFENAQELLTYHTMSGNDIIIRMEDYKCLDHRELLSDVILDFYMQYVFKELMTPEMRDRTHIYTTHFYRYLATSSNYAGWKEVKDLKAYEKRYERVKDFSCNNEVNIFDKDFVVFPCINNEHWFLAIACFLKLNGSVDYNTGDRITSEEACRDVRHPEVGQPAKTSCIIVFDSVKNNPGRKNAAINYIRNFLKSEYVAKYHQDFLYDESETRGFIAKCPNQSNATDCGLFVLQFMEHFFINSQLTDFRFPIELNDWFDLDIIFQKREQIAELIRNLMMDSLGDAEFPELPNIKFYNDSEEVQLVEPVVEDENSNNNNNISNNNEGDNNNQEEFNNNNDFNAIDNNNLMSNGNHSEGEVSGSVVNPDVEISNGHDHEPESSSAIPNEPAEADDVTYSEQFDGSDSEDSRSAHNETTVCCDDKLEHVSKNAENTESEIVNARQKSSSNLNEEYIKPLGEKSPGKSPKVNDSEVILLSDSD